MAASQSSKKKKASLPLSQRRRPRPSRVKAVPVHAATPAERLRTALELSDFCLLLHEAARRKS